MQQRHYKPKETYYCEIDEDYAMLIADPVLMSESEFYSQYKELNLFFGSIAFLCD